MCPLCWVTVLFLDYDRGAWVGVVLLLDNSHKRKTPHLQKNNHFQHLRTTLKIEQIFCKLLLEYRENLTIAKSRKVKLKLI